jgi:hypothetical protein
MTYSSDSAKKIAGGLLALSGKALMADDFDTFHKTQHLPLPIETIDGHILVTSTEQMRDIFDSVRAHQRRIGVTSVRRDVTNANFFGKDKVELVYTSYIYREQDLAQSPYTSYALFQEIDGAWKVIFSMYAISDAPSHNAALMNVMEQGRLKDGAIC